MQSYYKEEGSQEGRKGSRKEEKEGRTDGGKKVIVQVDKERIENYIWQFKFIKYLLLSLLTVFG